jgi:hypothetical protein
LERAVIGEIAAGGEGAVGWPEDEHSPCGVKGEVGQGVRAGVADDLGCGPGQGDIGVIGDNVSVGELQRSAVDIVSAAGEGGAVEVGERTADDIQRAARVRLTDSVIGKTGCGWLDG